jgi:soluble lytic murein transglycosylase
LSTLPLRFEFLCVNPYVLPVRIRRLTALLLGLLMFSAGVSCGASLAEDSTRFAACWSRLQAGDTTSAIAMLAAESDSDHDKAAANFFLAWLALRQRRFADVPAILARGVPPELADHARRLEAEALSRAGNDAAADSLWRLLAFDTCSVHAGEACYRLAKRASDLPDFDLLMDLSERCELLGCEVSRRQEIAGLAAAIEVEKGRHEAVVKRLRSAYLAAPATAEGMRIRDELLHYARRHGYKPPDLTADELQSEMEGLAQANAFKSGLSRVIQLMQSPAGPKNAELLGHFKGRFESGLRRHRDAVRTLHDHHRRFPQSPWRSQTLYYLGRSAYLTDQDSLALTALNGLAADSLESTWRTSALDLLGTLHRDRGRPEEAVRAYLRWDSLSGGREPECLWRLGWALWEANRKGDAADVWLRLTKRDERSDWTAGALYWCARTLDDEGRTASAESLRFELERRFSRGYYSVISPSRLADSLIVEVPLAVPSLDEIAASGGEHARKFSLLAALRLADLALLEWPVATAEVPPSDGLTWWKARLHLWDGDLDSAWRLVLSKLGFYIRAAGARPEDFFALVYPLEWRTTIAALSAQHGLDPYFVLALICQESHFDADAVSPAGAVGLMQLMPATAKRQTRKLGLSYSAARLRDPDLNLRLGVAHLADLFRDFSGDTLLVLAAYNAGPSAAQAWFEEFGDCPRDVFVERIPYRETRLFIKRNIEHKAAYQRLYPRFAQEAVATPSSPHGQ